MRADTASGRLCSLTGLLTVAVALIALVPASAFGVPKQIGGFIGGGTGPGSNVLSNHGGLFFQPRDVAVFEGTDSVTATDKIFVTEGQGSNHRVTRLDVHGNF